MIIIDGYAGIETIEEDLIAGLQLIVGRYDQDGQRRRSGHLG